MRKDKSKIPTIFQEIMNIDQALKATLAENPCNISRVRKLRDDRIKLTEGAEKFIQKQKGN